MLKTKVSRMILVTGIPIWFLIIHYTDIVTWDGIRFDDINIFYIATLLVPPLIASILIPLKPTISKPILIMGVLISLFVIHEKDAYFQGGLDFDQITFDDGWVREVGVNSILVGDGEWYENIRSRRKIDPIAYAIVLFTPPLIVSIGIPWIIKWVKDGDD